LNLRERIMTVLRHGEPDVVPWVVYQGLVPTGSLERRLRDGGMALCQWQSVIWTETPNVRVEDRVEGRTTYRTYHTPVGKVHSVLRSTPLGRGVRTTWTVERMVKSVQDYDVVKFIVKDTVYHYDPEPFLEAQRWLGDDGIVRASVDVSPLQQMLKTYLGFERFSLDLYRHPMEFNDLYQVIEERAEEAYKIVANSPAEVICAGENIDGVLTNPRLFEKYCLPFYNRMARILHQRGKIYLTHMDGRLNCLKNLISRTDIDGIEAFTPPLVGDLPLKEARALWGKKIIWANFPETIFLLGADETRRFTRELLKTAAPGDNFLVGITEDIHPDYIEEGLSAVTETINQHGNYPIPTIE